MTSAGTSAVPLVLLAIGVSGFVGTLVIGVFIRRGLYRTLVTIPALMALIAVALVPLGPQLWPTAALLSARGLLATAAPVGWWSWLAGTFTDNAEAGGGLMVAVVQCSIALGSTVGGLLLTVSALPVRSGQCWPAAVRRAARLCHGVRAGDHVGAGGRCGGRG